MNTTKIITHSGLFHGDDIVATALALILSPEAVVTRTFTPSKEDIKNPLVCILDIGREFNPKLNNFDHHSDPSLDCAAMELYKAKKDQFSPFHQKAIESFLVGVNLQDLGLSNNEQGCMSLSHFISSFNPIDDNEDAFQEVVMIIVSLIGRKAMFFAQQEDFRESAVTAIDNQFKLCAFTDKFNPALKNMCIETDVRYTCQPGERGGVMLTCVPPELNSFAQKETINAGRATKAGATFVHNSGFCAAFENEKQVKEYLNG